MPKYYGFKVCDHILYFTTHCTVEAMHVHAGNDEMNERIAAKFFVKANGDTVLQKIGDLKPHQVSGIQQFIKENYREMYVRWQEYSDTGFYSGKSFV